MKNAQKIFSKVYRGLAKQGFKRSMGKDGICKFRGKEGMRCAIGQLIPNKLYKPGFDEDGEGVYGLPDVLISKITGERDSDLARRFLSPLMDVHDAPAKGGRTSMKNRLAEFAVKNNLKVPKLST